RRKATSVSASAYAPVSHGSSCLANLGSKPESRCDSGLEYPKGIRANATVLMKIFRCVCPALIAAALTGCTLAPKYERPVAPVSPTWPSGRAYASNQLGGFTTNAAADIGWREFFQDAR